MFKRCWGVTLAISLSSLGTACTEREGPAENLGERIDDTISDVRDRVEDAADDAADRINDALDEN